MKHCADGAVGLVTHCDKAGIHWLGILIPAPPLQFCCGMQVLVRPCRISQGSSSLPSSCICPARSQGLLSAKLPYGSTIGLQLQHSMVASGLVSYIAAQGFKLWVFHCTQQKLMPFQSFFFLPKKKVSTYLEGRVIEKGKRE